MLNILLYSIITNNYRYIMRLHFIVYFEIVCFACISSLPSLLTVQDYKILVLWYHWGPTILVVIGQIMRLITNYA